MNFVEQDILGVYIAPATPMLILAWIVTSMLRRLADRYGILQYFWHPPIVVLAFYIIVLSTIVLYFPI